MGHTIIIYTVAGRGHATPKFSAHYTSYACTEWHNTCIYNVHDICILSLIIYIYIQCRDTYWVESFNHQLLTYLPKRIHFSTRTFNMRMNLALLDWVRYYVCAHEAVLITGNSIRMRMWIAPTPAFLLWKTCAVPTAALLWRFWWAKPSSL